jgi:hypothetical protein
VRKFIIAAVGAAVLVPVAGSISAEARSSTEDSVHAARSCGSVGGRGRRWDVTIENGGVSCRTARKVLRAFLHGKGRMHGPRNGPASDQYWTLYGWKCGNGAGAVGCNRHHFRDYILAES